MAETTPSLEGFIAFCRSIVGIPEDAMADDDPGFQDALDFALAWMPDVLKCAPGRMRLLYVSCTYNWGASLILQFQQDQVGTGFFAAMRAKFGTLNFVPGVVSSTADESTSTTLTVGKALQNLSLMDLQRAKDPFGRQALSILMQFGPNVWGVS